MPNYHFAPRGSFAVILPSTNVAVEAEYGQMVVPGIAWHSGRILIRDPVLDSDEKFDQFMIEPEVLKEAFRSVNGPDVEALVQAGTNLFCAKVAATMELELSKPVIAINTATVWHAYRTHGISDQIKGFGCLLEKH
jgi:maleate cis-trans isomerase